MANDLDPLNCACLNLRMAARAATQFYDAALQPSGLRTTQFTILYAVSRMAPVTISALSAVLVMDRTTLTRNLRPLTAAGLVRIAAGSEDRRSREITLTRKGMQVLGAARPLWEAAQRRFLGKLGPETWQSLATGLSRAIEAARG